MTPNLDNQQSIPEDAICHEHMIMGCTLNHKALEQPDELEIILTLLRAGDDPETKQPHITWDEAKQRLIAWRDRAVRETQIDELKAVQSGNDDFKVSYQYDDGCRVDIIDRLAQLTKESIE